MSYVRARMRGVDAQREFCELRFATLLSCGYRFLNWSSYDYDVLSTSFTRFFFCLFVCANEALKGGNSNRLTILVIIIFAKTERNQSKGIKVQCEQNK